MYVESNIHFQPPSSGLPNKAFMKNLQVSPPLPVEWSALGGGIAGIMPT